MKKLLIVTMLLLFGVANAQTIGLYCNHTQVSPGQTTQLEFRVDSSIPVVYVSLRDNSGFHHLYDEFTGSYIYTTDPLTETTTFELYFAKTRQGECTIDQNHKIIQVVVTGGGGGGGGGQVNVETIFDLPSSICPYADPIDLSTIFTTNVTGGSLSFSGSGVSGNIFYPSNANSGSQAITANLYYNGQTYSNTRNIYVYEKVSLWLPSTVSIDSQPFVLSGTPSGGTYSGHGVFGNMFYPNRAGVGTHEITYTYNGTCGDVVRCEIRVTYGTGVEENDEDTEFSVYPNPTNGVVNFSVPCTVKVISLMSVTVRIQSTLQESLDLSDLPSGVYQLLIYTEDGSTLERKVSKY
jgi:hypothetical protein